MAITYPIRANGAVDAGLVLHFFPVQGILVNTTHHSRGSTL